MNNIKPEVVIVGHCCLGEAAVLELAEHNIPIVYNQSAFEPEPIPIKMTPRLDYDINYYPEKGSKYHK